MNKRISNLPIEFKRGLNIEEACEYTGMGRAMFRKWAETIGAVKRFGSRVIFDKAVIDEAFDNYMEEMV